MMFSTSPMVSAYPGDLPKSIIASAGNLMPHKVETSEIEHKIRSVQQEDDSTDVGSSSSDVDVSSCSFTSPCCTDNEMQVGREVTNLQPLSTYVNPGKHAQGSRGVVPENIASTLVGKYDHETFFFTQAPQAAARWGDRQSMDTPDAKFRAPPGLSSPAYQTRKLKDGAISNFTIGCIDASQRLPQTSYRTDSFRAPPGLPSPTRRRKSKAIALQSMLATAPLPKADVLCLPTSPDRHTRIAIIEKAKRHGVPLKVEPQIDNDLPIVPLKSALPAKKMLPFLNEVANSFDQSIRKLKPGMPVKKRVTPWLLEHSSPIVSVAPR